MTRLFAAKPFLIAEVGSNWRTLDDCLKSIAEAKACGADAVKFQLFTREALYGLVVGGSRDHELPMAWLPTLKQTADEAGIEFMCTAFSPTLVAVVDPFVEVHKVASSDAAWPQMLDAVRATGKPALVSFGAKTVDEVQTIERKMMWEGDKYVSLYCVAAYPAAFVDFEVLDSFDGFSDHTLGLTAAVEAARRGTLVIEKHFTAFPSLDTPDRPHSLDPADFLRMVRLIRGEPSTVGPTVEEHAMLLRHNRRLIATRDVVEGEELRYGVNYGAYRSLEDDVYGISPLDWERVEGKCATKALERGKGIGEGDFA